MTYWKLEQSSINTPNSTTRHKTDVLAGKDLEVTDWLDTINKEMKWWRRGQLVRRTPSSASLFAKKKVTWDILLHRKHSIPRRPTTPGHASPPRPELRQWKHRLFFLAISTHVFSFLVFFLHSYCIKIAFIEICAAYEWTKE